jgi:hypothetical protein
MTEDQFWNLIDQSRAKPPAACKLLQKVRAAVAKANGGNQFLPRLRALLNALQPAEIKDFKIILDRQLARANTWELWAAAYIMMGGCSDDGFEYWRAWLISQGRTIFDEAIANPESLAAHNFGSPEEMELEALLYVAAEAFESKTGADLYEQLPQRNGPSEPTGEPWEEDSSVLEARFPLLWAKYG